MSINNVTFSYQEIVAYTKLNQLSADATNTTDNIHPQYVLEGGTSGTFVQKAGDTMTGALTVPKMTVIDGNSGTEIFTEGQTTYISNLGTTAIQIDFLTIALGTGMSIDIDVQSALQINTSQNFWVQIGTFGNSFNIFNDRNSFDIFPHYDGVYLTTGAGTLHLGGGVGQKVLITTDNRALTMRDKVTSQYWYVGVSNGILDITPV